MEQPTDEAVFVQQVGAYPRARAWLGVGEPYELTRFVLLRLLGFVYAAAFVSLLWQVLPLIGAHGLTPAATYNERVLSATGSLGDALLAEPSLFLVLPPTDTTLLALAGLGLGLSLALLGGATHAAMVVLWVLYRAE